MKIIGIYKITSPSGRVYIGQSCDVKYRLSLYKKCRCKSQTKLYNSLLKYGAEAHTFEVILECNSSDLDQMEQHYIDHFDSIKRGLNLRAGGSRGAHSEESRLKMSIAQKRNSADISARISRRNIGNQYARGRKLSKEKIELLKVSKVGKPVGMSGKKHSPESIEKMRAAKVGKIRPKETGRKISAKLKGSKKSPEWRAKISAAMKGNRNKAIWNENVNY